MQGRNRRDALGRWGGTGCGVPVLRRAPLRRPQGREVPLHPLQEELLLQGGNDIRGQQPSAYQVVHSDVPHILPQEGDFVVPAGEGHQRHAENSVVRAAQGALPVRPGRLRYAFG